MRDRTKLRAFELADGLTLSKRLGFLPNEDSWLIEPKGVETAKAFNGLMRALGDVLWPSAFRLNT